GVDVGELTAEDAALVVCLLDRHKRAAHFVLSGIAELPGRIEREADQNRLVGPLCPDAVVLPRAEKGETGDGGSLQHRAAREPRFRLHGISSPERAGLVTVGP